MPDNDPRVFFAAERTALAWVRTAIGLIGLGFVVARFGLFLQLVRPELATAPTPSVSSWVGVGLALLGSVAAGVAAVAALAGAREDAAPADGREER